MKENTTKVPNQSIPSEEYNVIPSPAAQDSNHIDTSKNGSLTVGC